MAQKRVYINLDLCCGCKSCSAACSYPYLDHSNLSHGAVSNKASLPMHCMHCELPACAEVCPTGSLKKHDDGVVRRAPFTCVGCRSCVSACPFGVLPDEFKYHMPAKCDLCLDRVVLGKVPRCVATCTSGALSFEDVGDAANSDKKAWVSGRMRANAAFRRR